MHYEQSGAPTLGALVSVARRHGVDLNVDALRASYVDLTDGMPTATLITIANEAGLKARCIRSKWSQLSRLSNILPAIVRLKDGGAAVLLAVSNDPQIGQLVVLENPDAGPEREVALDEPQLDALWTGEVILIKRRHETADEQQPFGLRWLLNQLLVERQLFRDIGIAALISTSFALIPPFLVMIIIDKVMVNHSTSTLWVLAAGLGLLILFEMTMGYLKRSFTEIAASRIDGRLNLYLMGKLLALPLEYFDRNPTGLTVSKLGKVWQVRQFLSGQLFNTVLDLITLFVLVPALFILQWQLAFLVLALAGIIFLVIYAFLKPMRERYGKVIRAEQAKGTFLSETTYGMRTIKSLAIEGRRMHSWDVHVARSGAARLNYGKLANLPPTLTLPFERLIYAGSFMVGAALSLTRPDIVMPGALMAFAMLAGRTAQPLVQLAKLLQDVGEVRGAISEAASILNYPPEESRVGSGLRLPVEGNVTFQNVDFRYSEGAPQVLSGVSFQIRPGTIFGIMGRSGSGKTTITRMLQGLSARYEGIIKIDGMDLREIDLRHLRTNIGVVAQDSFLFSGTIRENIGIARPNATFAEVVRAAQLAGAEEFIERLPRGYDTYLAEGGIDLSGGQRQRLAIARALVTDPPVLILDEATSALDAESEAIINANLLRIAQSRTIICVSHRLAMLVPADAILVMEKGRVYDIGTHHELLQRCDIYENMWQMQNRNTHTGNLYAPLTVAHSAAL
jgi:ATP-binding cassette, subfamily B, bacterial HlyB/CyaB